MQQPMDVQGRLLLAAEHADRLRGDPQPGRQRRTARRRVGEALVAAGMRLAAAEPTPASRKPAHLTRD